MTLDDVAAAAGVSRATASRALNGIATVAPGLAQTVLQAAHELGYRPNPAARSLARGRHDSLALIVPEADFSEFTHSFFSMPLRGAIKAVSKTDYQLVMVLLGLDEGEEKFLRYLDASHVDGAMVVLESHNLALPRLLSRSRVPVVYLGRPAESEALGCSFVDVDNVGGGRLAAQALIAAGRTRIGTVTGPLEMGVASDRLLGWAGALADAGLRSDAVVHGDFTIGGGEEAMERLLVEHPDLDGVFVASDFMSIGALKALRAAGRTVPGDLSLVSFDDTVVATTVEPQLTTVHQPLEQLGELMVELLQELVEDPSRAPIRRQLPTHIVWRDSV